jgi:uncharacterized protein
LLIWTGDQNFLFLVPWLVFGGTVLFVLEPRLSRSDGSAHQDRGLATALWPLAAAVVFVVAIYGGYFGAGIGILMISASACCGWETSTASCPSRTCSRGALGAWLW